MLLDYQISDDLRLKEEQVYHYNIFAVCVCFLQAGVIVKNVNIIICPALLLILCINFKLISDSSRNVKHAMCFVYLQSISKSILPSQRTIS